jgi:copper transport protein
LSLRTAIWIAKFFLYVGLFIGAGGVFSLCCLSPDGRAGRRVVITTLLGGIGAAVLSLGFQGLDALGIPLARLAEPIVWRTAMDTSFAWTVLIALAALGLGLLSLRGPRIVAKTLSLAALAGVGVSLAASGHASAAEPQWLTRPMVFLHGVGIAFWAGALVPLGLALKRTPVETEPFLRRFSNTILPVVAVLTVAGIVLAVIQVQTLSALVTTAYGRLLLVKLALLAILFALAAFNRWRLTMPVEGGNGMARKKLVRSIIFETLVVLAIFGVAAGWRFTPPPRALAIAAAQPVSMHIHTLKAMADLSITPGHTGQVAASIVVMTGDFGPLDAKEVTLVLSKPDSGIEPLKRPAKKAGDGTWRVDDLVIPLPGKWTVGLDILVSDFDAVKIEGVIDIRP